MSENRTTESVAVQWLKGKGVKFIKGGADAWRMNTLAADGGHSSCFKPLLPED